MQVVGLTGGIGMGKSACAELVRGRSIPVIDTDELARDVVEPGQPALSQIQQVFGSKVLTADGRLDRERLAACVFADSSARKQLEAILHPRIRDLWRARTDLWRQEGRTLAFVVIPLLFETRAEKELDVTICVACSVATQHQRLQARGWSSQEIDGRIRAQLPVEQKMVRAQFVIWTEGSLEIHAAQLDRILGSLQGPLRSC